MSSPPPSIFKSIGRNLNILGHLTNHNIRKYVKLYVNGRRNELPQYLRNVQIGDWDVSRVTDMSRLFERCEGFNQPLNGWNVSRVTDMQAMFASCHSFNQPLNDWNVSNVTDMRRMFSICTEFNQPLNNWNVTNVMDMVQMFEHCNRFNQPLNNWNVTNVDNMEMMFFDCNEFNQPLNNWNVSNVENMERMFDNCTEFNQPLNNWNVSNVRNMEKMFFDCTQFNQPLNNWVITNVRNMESMFEGCTQFNQSLTNWNINRHTNTRRMFRGCPNYNPHANTVQNHVEGRAHEIHNMFKDLDITKFMGIIKKENGKKHAFKNEGNPLQPIVDYISGETETKLSADEKTRFIQHLSAPNGKVYNLFNSYLSAHAEAIPIATETIQFVLSQPQAYKDLYISSFTTECYNAYNTTGETQVTCVQGVFERIVLINKSVIQYFCSDEINNLFPGATSACKPVYLEIFKCFYPDVDIASISAQWFDKFDTDNNPDNDLVNATPEERIDHFRKFIKSKLTANVAANRDFNMNLERYIETNKKMIVQLSVLAYGKRRRKTKKNKLRKIRSTRTKSSRNK